MKTYELTYIVSPEITSEEAQAKGKEIESVISSKEGTILRQSNPIAKTLAYPIKKHASGFAGFLEFQLEPEKLVELKEIIAKDGKIVRHMLIIKEAAEFKKERRTRTKPIPALEIEPKIKEPASAESSGAAKEEKPDKAATKEKEKVELKDIEQKLEELLNN
jgi:ribosomal protein S6